MVAKVFLIGLGMGNPDTLTCGGLRALQQSDLVIGSRRLLDALGDLPARKVALVAAKDIVAELAASDEGVASVVLSGDVGFYSGATSLYGMLDAFDVQVIPGISSLSYLCAQLRTTWQDVYATSAHGRDCDVVEVVRSHARVFLLTGGDSSVASVCAELAAHGLGNAWVSVGERLSYEDERLTQGSAAELAERSFDALSVMLIEREGAPCKEAR